MPSAIPSASPPPEEPATAADRVDEALEADLIDFPTAVLYRMYASFGDPRLPEDLQGPAVDEDPLPFVVATDPTVTLPDEIRAELATYLARPTDPDSAFHGTAGAGAVPALARSNAVTAALTCVDAWASQPASVPMKTWARCVGATNRSSQRASPSPMPSSASSSTSRASGAGTCSTSTPGSGFGRRAAR